jgi:DNA-binding LacI/PurR family transcriptional regulator/GAF domain-containing protein
MITSHDVARLAGVSQATVSRALRDERGVSTETRTRVRAAARELGYVTGHTGRALATRRTRKIAVVSAELSNPFYTALIAPLQVALDRHGLQTVLVTESDERPLGLSALMDGSFDGVVLTTCERTSGLPAELSVRGIPFVIANRSVDAITADTCVVDNRRGAAMVADLLVELGHQRIAAVMGPDATSTGHERCVGFLDRLRVHGVPVDALAVVRGPFDPSTGRAGLERLLGEGSPAPTAVFCGNDVIALGVLDAALGLGVRVPEDLTVVGFDDIPLAAWGRFNLTTVHVDLAQMAETVAETLVARLHEPEAPARRVILEPHLLARGTHALPHSRLAPGPPAGRPEARTLRSWMSAVGAVARALNSSHSPDAVLTVVAKRACELIGFDYCAVMLADEQERDLVVVGFDGLSSAYVELVSDDRALQIHPGGPARDTPAARAFRERRTIVVPDTRSATVFGRLRDLAPAQGYRSLLATPLKQPGTVRGLLVGYLQEPHTFTALEIELAELLAEQTSIVLQTADLRRAQQDVIQELSAVNEEMAVARAQIEWAESQHRRLMQLVLDDAGLAGVCEALAEILRSSITVESESGRRLAQAAWGEYTPPPAPPWRLVDDAAEHAIARVAGADEAWTAPVVLGGAHVGRLWVTGLPGPLSPIEGRAIERFALVVGVELLQRKHLVEVRERLSGDLIADLLRPDGIAQPAALLDRAAALGLDLAEPHSLVVVTPAISGRTAALSARCRDCVPTGMPSLIGVHDDAVVVLLPATADPIATVGRLHGHAGGPAVRDAPITVVGRPVDEVSGYLAAYRIATGVTRLRADSGPGVVDVRSLGTAALLLARGGPPRDLRVFARRVLGGLLDPRDDRSRELINTLRVWLGNGCSAARTASALTVHLNTAAYRLRRIADILGCDLGDTDTRLDLRLALLVHDITDVGGEQA